MRLITPLLNFVTICLEIAEILFLPAVKPAILILGNVVRDNDYTFDRFERYTLKFRLLVIFIQLSCENAICRKRIAYQSLYFSHLSVTELKPKLDKRLLKYSKSISLF